MTSLLFEFTMTIHLSMTHDAPTPTSLYLGAKTTKKNTIPSKKDETTQQIVLYQTTKKNLNHFQTKVPKSVLVDQPTQKLLALRRFPLPPLLGCLHMRGHWGERGSTGAALHGAVEATACSAWSVEMLI